MENTTLTARWYKELTVPELWYMYARGGCIFITFTKTCWDILQRLGYRNEAMRPHETQRWGSQNIFPPVKKSNKGVYRFYISLRDQIDGEKRKSIAESLSYLTGTLNILVIHEAAQNRNPFREEQLQLFSLETYYTNHTHFHACGMGVSVSPEAAEFLDKYSKSAIPGVHNAMKEHHLAFYPKDKKKGADYFLHDLYGVIREEATLHFVTHGNCACLGRMPEKIRKDGGLYIESHNLDTTWQQLSMLVGVATTWRWVRRSLGYK